MRILSAIAALSLVASCATPIVPLSEQKSNFPTLDVAIVETDDKVIISLEQPASATTMAPMVLPPGTTIGQAAAAGAAGGLIAGLIMAGIESAERADAAKDIEPVQEALGDVRFGPSIRDALLTSLRDLEWTSIENVQVVDFSERDALRNVFSETDAPGVMTLATSNFLSRNASTLVFSARVSIIPKPTEVTRRGKAKIPPASFVSTVGFEVAAPVSGDRRVDFLPTWAANDAELIRAAAAQAEPLLAEMIFYQMRDGNIPAEKPAEGRLGRRFVHFYGIPLNQRVQVLESRPDGDLVRTESGSLRFLATRIEPLADTAETLDALVSDNTEIGEEDGAYSDLEITPKEEIQEATDEASETAEDVVDQAEQVSGAVQSEN